MFILKRRPGCRKTYYYVDSLESKHVPKNTSYFFVRIRYTYTMSSAHALLGQRMQIIGAAFIIIVRHINKVPHPGYCKSCKKLIQTSPSSPAGFRSSWSEPNYEYGYLHNVEIIRLYSAPTTWKVSNCIHQWCRHCCRTASAPLRQHCHPLSSRNNWQWRWSGFLRVKISRERTIPKNCDQQWKSSRSSPRRKVCETHLLQRWSGEQSSHQLERQVTVCVLGQVSCCCHTRQQGCHDLWLCLCSTLHILSHWNG